MTKETDKISAGALVQQKTRPISQSNMKTADDKYTAETPHVCFAEIERVKAFTTIHKRRSMAKPCNGLSVRKNSTIQTKTHARII